MSSGAPSKRASPAMPHTASCPSGARPARTPATIAAEGSRRPLRGNKDIAAFEGLADVGKAPYAEPLPDLVEPVQIVDLRTDAVEPGIDVVLAEAAPQICNPILEAHA